MRPRCGCRYWANQYAAGFNMCTKHGTMMVHIAAVQGITVQQAFDRALDEYFKRLGCYKSDEGFHSM